MDAVKTGGLIAQVRREKELTQKDLAEVLHVSVQAVSKWENGRSCPDIALLEPLAEALGLTVTELLSGERGEEPGEEAVRDSLRFGESQLRPKIRQWKGLFLAAALVLAEVLLILGYLWVRDNTEWLPQRETTVRGLDVSERESQVARALGAAGHDLHLYEVTLADDFTDCTIRAELWSHEGMEQSWTLMESSADDRKLFGPRRQFLVLRMELLTGEWLEERGAWEGNQLLYGISFGGFSSSGALDGLPERYLQDGMGWSRGDGKRIVNREEGGLTLLTLSLGNGYGGLYTVGGLPPEHENAISLAVRMYCK